MTSHTPATRAETSIFNRTSQPALLTRVMEHSAALFLLPQAGGGGSLWDSGAGSTGSGFHSVRTVWIHHTGAKVSDHFIRNHLKAEVKARLSGLTDVES